MLLSISEIEITSSNLTRTKGDDHGHSIRRVLTKIDDNGMA